MIRVDIKALIDRLNPYCVNCLEAAAGMCVSRTHYEVTVEHMLTKLMDSPRTDIPLILKQFDIDPGRLQKALDQTMEGFSTGNASKPVFSPILLDWLQDAWLVASVDMGEARLRSGAMLISLLNRPLQLAAGNWIEILDNLSRDTIAKQFWDLVKGSSEKAARSEVIEAEAGRPEGETALDRFCVDFTARAGNGEIDPVFGRDSEIRQMVDILARRRKNNPIVVGEAGVGKTAVVEGLALRIVEEDVPEILQDVAIMGLDMGLLQAGAGMKGEFENRLKSVINEIKASEKPIIMFIDEAHTLIGAGGAAGMSDAANLLKPALARGELRTIAATTWSEYKKYFEKDAALARRFQPVKLDEPDVETAKLILRGLKSKYESAHKVVVRDDAIEAAAELSSRYISGRQLPDKAVDLLDTSAARVKILLSATPDVIEDKQRRIQAIDRELEAMARDRLHGVATDAERQQELENERRELEQKAAQLKERWLKEQELARRIIDLQQKLAESSKDEEQMQAIEKELADLRAELAQIQGEEPLVRTEVDPDVVSKVVSDWTGVPLGKMMRDEAASVVNLEDNLRQRIKGQDQALAAICKVIQSAKAGIKDPNQPLGVFLLVGPSGVGKTETGLAIADLLFGGENFMVTINMSEFQEKHTVSRLIGSPPGYVGYGEGGVLTEAVRQRPYSVVLLDEVEKGHLEVMNLFYQVFDKGMLSDGEGRLIDFRNTIIFLTSNLATDVITEMCTDGRPDLEVVESAVRPILSDHFKPALLARMTLVPYLTLDNEIIKQIVDLKMGKLARRLAETHRMELVYTPAVADQIAARCTEVETGARNIDAIMNGSIMPRMSQEILARMTQAELPSKVVLDLDDQGGFMVKFEEA